MNNKEFLERLNKPQSKDQKIEVLQFFIDNYPVSINHHFKKNEQTRIYGCVITGGSERLVNYSFEALKKRGKELKNFKITD